MILPFLFLQLSPLPAASSLPPHPLFLITTLAATFLGSLLHLLPFNTHADQTKPPLSPTSLTSLPSTTTTTSSLHLHQTRPPSNNQKEKIKARNIKRQI